MNRYFSFKLYKDGLRQLKIFGIFSIIIIGLVSVFSPISAMLNEQENNYITTINGANINILLVLCTFVLAPVFVLYLFSFLNKRNTSDFYHSIPMKKLCVYNSYMASVITWLTIIIVVNLVVSYGLFSTLTSCVLYNRTIFTYVLNVWIGSIYTAVTVSLAMCISGTALTNIVVSGIILFLPRVYICVISACICNLSFMSLKYFLPLLTPSYNIVFGTITALLGLGNSNPFYLLSASVYTLCLAVIYYLISMVLFTKRKSETAGCSAPSKRLQNVYRILVAFVICLIPIAGISTMFITEANYRVTSEDILMVVIFYVIAVLVYFAYEIITTRTFRHLLKTLPGLGMLVLLNVLSLCIIQGGVTKAKSFTPETDEIDYVYLLGEDDYSTFGEYDNEYYTYLQSKIKLDDTDIKKIVSESLKQQINNSDNYYAPMYTIKIKSGNKTYYRRMQITEKNINIIAQKLKNNEEYKEKYTHLPDYNSLGTSFYIDNYYTNDVPMSNNQRKTLYESVQKEIEELGYDTWYERYQGGVYSSTTFYINTFVGTQNCTIYFPFECLPKSYLLYAKMMTTDEKITIANEFLSDPCGFSSYMDCNIFIEDTQTLETYSANIFNDASQENYLDTDTANWQNNVIRILNDFVEHSNYEDFENSRYIINLQLMTDQSTYSLFIPVKGSADISAIKKTFGADAYSSEYEENTVNSYQ